MRRVQPGGFGGTRDPEDEKKKSRESVLANLVIFAAFVAIIRVGKFTLNSLRVL